MPNLNKVMLMGNLTRDPDIKYTPKGTAVSGIGLAINRSFTAETGEKRDETVFVDITFWGRQAEIVHEFCKKGSPLYVEGRLQFDVWEDKTSGQKRNKLRIIGESFQFLSNKTANINHSNDGSNISSYQPSEHISSHAPSNSSMPINTRQHTKQEELEDDDIPF